VLKSPRSVSRRSRDAVLLPCKSPAALELIESNQSNPFLYKNKIKTCERLTSFPFTPLFLSS
jgi:hypothetical protein